METTSVYWGFIGATLRFTSSYWVSLDFTKLVVFFPEISETLIRLYKGALDYNGYHEIQLGYISHLISSFFTLVKKDHPWDDYYRVRLSGSYRVSIAAQEFRTGHIKQGWKDTQTTSENEILLIFFLWRPFCYLFSSTRGVPPPLRGVLWTETAVSPEAGQATWNVNK